MSHSLFKGDYLTLDNRYSFWDEAWSIDATIEQIIAQRSFSQARPSPESLAFVIGQLWRPFFERLSVMSEICSTAFTHGRDFGPRNRRRRIDGELYLDFRFCAFWD